MIQSQKFLLRIREELQNYNWQKTVLFSILLFWDNTMVFCRRKDLNQTQNATLKIQVLHWKMQIISNVQIISDFKMVYLMDISNKKNFKDNCGLNSWAVNDIVEIKHRDIHWVNTVISKINTTIHLNAKKKWNFSYQWFRNKFMKKMKYLKIISI